MWRLKARWKVISPVPVTLNLFLALELVLTLGILVHYFDYTLLAFPHWRKSLEPFGQCWFSFNSGINKNHPYKMERKGILLL